MHLCCSICTEQIVPADELNVTTCGHMFHIACLKQWLARSNTCPQCRHSCKNVIRLYLNVSLNDTVLDDPVTLQNANDNLMLQVRKLEASNRKCSEDLTASVATQKKARRTIVELEAQLEQKDMLMRAQETMHNEMKLAAKRVPTLELEILKVRKQFATLEAIQNVVNSTALEVEAVMSCGHSIRSLSTMVVVLKREIRASEAKRQEMRKMVGTVQADLKQSRAQESQLKDKISALESDLAKALDDYRTLSERGTPVATANKSLTAGQSIESPHLPSPGLSISAARNSGETVINSTPKPVAAEATEAAAAPTGSPYLKIAKSSIGLAALPKNRPKVARLSQHSVDSIRIRESAASGAMAAPSSSSSAAAAKQQQFSIFKKARFSVEPLGSRDNNRVANGLGGTDRRDAFATYSYSRTDSMP